MNADELSNRITILAFAALAVVVMIALWHTSGA